RPPEQLVFLLEQPVPLLQLTDFGRFGAGLAGLCARVDVRTTQPLRERHRVDPEVFRDLLDRRSGLTVAGNAHDVVTELARVGLSHNNILPGPPSRASQIRCHLSMPQTREKPPGCCVADSSTCTLNLTYISGWSAEA